MIISNVINDSVIEKDSLGERGEHYPDTRNIADTKNVLDYVFPSRVGYRYS